MIDNIHILEQTARDHGVGFVVVRLSSDASAVMLPEGSGVIELSLDDPALMERLAAPALVSESARQPLIELAQQLNGRGIEARMRGDLWTAYACYRYVMGVTAYHQEHGGLQAATWSTWILRETLRETTVRGNSAGPVEELRALASLISTDAKQLLGLKPPPLLAYQLANLAGDVATRREILFGLCDEAAARNDWSTALVPLLQEVAASELVDLLSGLTGKEDIDRSFERLWQFYLDARPHLQNVPARDELLSALRQAFSQLEFLRLYVTTAGGTFGHQLSYAISERMQVVARDLIEMMDATAVDDALDVFERARARALADRMTRSHGIPKTPRQRLNGVLKQSANATEPLSGAEIVAIAGAIQAPIITYVARRGGYLVIVRTPGGAIVQETIDDPADLIRELVLECSLPYYSASRHGASRAIPAISETADVYPSVLSRLHDALLPPRIRQAIGSRGRLVVITDERLDLVPFCALQGPDGRYLVEDREIVYWPSATAWQVTQVRQTMPEGKPRFFGDPLVEYEVDGDVFLPLSGAREEATRLARATSAPDALLGSEATTEELFASDGVSIVHLAMHGMLDEEQPASSFLAFADRPLTARELYERDAFLRTQLVVMSACQTALGQPHPDSGIGLTNAFLVAGARSVVSTLWQVPDDETLLLMEAFYGEMTAGAELDVTLAQAQRAVLRDWPHPVYWAAFKLTGSMRNPLGAA